MPSMWSREEDIQFEKAIAAYPDESSDRWEKIAADVPGKSTEEIKHHYELLLDDVSRIESGFVPVPSYNSPADGSISQGSDERSGGKKGSSNNSLGHANGDCNNGGKASKLEQERRKGIAWTEDEHRLFLLGLEKYGKGDWRSISRNFVVTRTPTQVASHAQKYFIRLNSMNKDRRRSSIHDITSVANIGGDPSSVHHQAPPPITGQPNGSTLANPSSKPVKPPMAAQVPVYGAPHIGQPIGGPAVGTPVHMPAHLGFGVGAPVTGPVVPGAPMGMGPLSYPVPPHTSAQR